MKPLNLILVFALTITANKIFGCELYATKILADNKFLGIIVENKTSFLAKYKLTDGKLDTTFGTRGQELIPLECDANDLKIYTTRSGTILVVNIQNYDIIAFSKFGMLSKSVAEMKKLLAREFLHNSATADLDFNEPNYTLFE